MALLNTTRAEPDGGYATGYAASKRRGITRRTGDNLFDAAGIAAATALVTGSIAWVFFGSGYALLAPAAYRVTTDSLVDSPVTGARAKALLAEKGYLSAFDTARLQSDAATPS